MEISPTREQLLKVLELLEHKDSLLLKLRFGFIDGKPKSIGELATIYKSTTEEIRIELRRVERLAQCKLHQI